jgi:hypothetical protein
MRNYAAAIKSNKSKPNEQQETKKNDQKQEKDMTINYDDDGEFSNNEEESTTSKKRDRDELHDDEGRKKKETMDTSMEIDGDVTIVGVTPGVAKVPAAKKSTTQKFEATLPEVWKMVNSKSTNRRQFNPDGRDTTPERANRSTFNFPFKTRITLKLQVSASERLNQEVIKTTKAFIKEIFKSDKNSAILPWKQSNEHKGTIKKPNDLPDNAYELRDYLHECWTPKPGEQRNIYPNIYLGHSEPMEHIRRYMGDYLSVSKQAIYPKMLQAEESVIAGFLVYSHNVMDAGALADEIEDHIGAPVGLRWRTIDIGIKGKIPENQRVNALHVEVEKKNKTKIMKKLFELYPRKMVQTHLYPNGIKMRFSKNKSDAINIPEKRKIDKLRARQEKFYKTVRKIEN